MFSNFPPYNDTSRSDTDPWDLYDTSQDEDEDREEEDESDDDE